MARAERHEKAIAAPVLGVVPDGASVLNPSEVRLGGDMAATLGTPEMSAPDLTSFLFTEEASLRLSGKHVSVFAAKGHSQEFLHGNGQRNAWTNWRGGVGLRHLRAIEQNHVRGMGIRYDFAYGGVANEVTTLRPFDGMRFADGDSHQVTFEVRYELLGCFAPFLHVQGGVQVHRPRWELPPGESWAAPLGAIVGAHREVGSEPIMVWGGYEVTGRGLDQFGRSFDQRVRLGAEAISLGDWGVRLGAAFEIMVGPVDGTFASVTATVPFTRHRGETER